NRWEVDSFYKEKTETTGWSVGQIRFFDSQELFEWFFSLEKTINIISATIAKRFRKSTIYLSSS
ncbi:MAG TPA: hypothetical protein VJ869_06155, partial [Sphaerochaeta sp.]|nr:hypothetical protein [Sphaerochaeta sp.]